MGSLADALNAEVVLGTVQSLKEAAQWLGYTYLFVRMMRNPLAYGVPWAELAADPRLEARRRSLVAEAAMDLLGVTRLEIGPWALREGVILERLDRIDRIGR